MGISVQAMCCHVAKASWPPLPQRGTLRPQVTTFGKPMDASPLLWERGLARACHSRCGSEQCWAMEGTPFPLQWIAAGKMAPSLPSPCTIPKHPRQQPAQPQYANYRAPLTRKRHIPPHPAQPRRTNYWAPRTRKRHQQEHRPQRPTESSDPTQHAKGRAGDCPGPRKETTTGRNVTQGEQFSGGESFTGEISPFRKVARQRRFRGV